MDYWEARLCRTRGGKYESVRRIIPNVECRITDNGKFNGLIKSRRKPIFVIPVETGIQFFNWFRRAWIPVCAGMTPFYEAIKFNPGEK